MAPQVFADRFIVVRPGEGVDLATGDTVWIRPVKPAGREAQAAWLRRCAALSGFWHPHLVSLIDYGAVGRIGFFEAWACPASPARWGIRDEATARAVSRAVSCLTSRSLTAGRLRWRSIIDLSGQPALLPNEESGFPLDSVDEVELDRCAFDLERMLSACKVSGTRQSLFGTGEADDTGTSEMSGGETRELVERLEDVLEGGVPGHPRAVRFSARHGTVGHLLPRALARLARLHGYVPVSTSVLNAGALDTPRLRRWRDVVDGRHVLLLQAGRRAAEAATGALFFVSLGLSSDRPHVLLQLDEPAFPAGDRKPPAVREESADYVTADGFHADGQRRWAPVPSHGSQAIATRTEAIAEAAERGRHARAERLLRETMGSYARRRDEAAAGESALALGRLLLVRGQPVEASRMLERARQHFERAHYAAGAVRAAVFAGLAWTDDGRLREAESAIRAARIAAVELPEPSLEELAMLALARCLFWQDRVVEAWDCLASAQRDRRGPTEPSSPALVQEWARLGGATCARERLQGAPAAPSPLAGLAARWSVGAVNLEVARGCLAARIALAVDDIAGAGRFAAEARERAGQSGNPTELAAACRAKASVYGVLGDVSAVRALVEEGIDAARSAHDPLRALRLRVVLAEALRRAGKSAEAAVVVARLARLDAARLPKVVSLPLERVIRGDSLRPAARAAVAPFPSGRKTGDAASEAPAVPARTAVVDTVVEVLGACQSSDDEAAVLQRVTAMLRERARAVSVACFGRDNDDLLLLLAADGGKVRAEDAARRAVESGMPIAPTATTSGLEAAAPIRFAGACVGAFSCRWAADSPPEWPVAGAVLAAASAAVAPCVRAELDRRATPSAPSDERPGELVGVSDLMANLRHEIERAARAPFHVVIEGESGSGKELVARAIHRLGPRRHGPLCALNCAALSDDLIEAELFGHARGAFTGAMTDRKGLFEEADRGILLLDEVGELSARAQAKVLRAIQEGEVRRVGENFTRSVDVRIVAATNRCLRAAVEAGVFRCDLRYRLEVIRIVVPPLRAHAEDIPVLAAHFWRQAISRVESRCTLTPETVAALARYDWPGNVRELQNVMAALAAAVGRRGSVGPDHLPAVIAGQAPSAGGQNLDQARRTFEARFVRAALARAGGRRAQAAGDLGLTRQGLAKLMARLGIE